MTDGSSSPDKRRSFVHHRLAQAGAEFADVGGGILAALTAGGADEAAAARRLALADLSPLPRIGYKGEGAPAWLRQNKVQIPAQPNAAQPQADGTLVAALSAQEHLLLSPIKPPSGGGVCQQLAAAWSLDSAAQCYQLPRYDSHCWFAVCGEHVGDMLAKLCGVDLRPESFAANAVAQTSLARVNTIVIRCPLGGTPAFYLLTDSASAEYLWDCLLDAMDEFSGAIIGLNALSALA